MERGARRASRRKTAEWQKPHRHSLPIVATRDAACASATANLSDMARVNNSVSKSKPPHESQRVQGRIEPRLSNAPIRLSSCSASTKTSKPRLHGSRLCPPLLSPLPAFYGPLATGLLCNRHAEPKVRQVTKVDLAALRIGRVRGERRGDAAKRRKGAQWRERSEAGMWGFDQKSNARIPGRSCKLVRRSKKTRKGEREGGGVKRKGKERKKTLYPLKTSRRAAMRMTNRTIMMITARARGPT